MPPPPARDPRAAPGVLLVGPGPRAEELAAVLAVLAAPRGVEARAFGDVAELALQDARAGLLLLDVDATPLEDVGYVRRFQAARADFEFVWIGTDPRSRTARVLGAQRFASWPPDVEELAAFVAIAQGAGGTGARSPRAPAAAQPAPPPSQGSGSPSRAVPPRDLVRADTEELEQVRAILDQDAGDELARPDLDDALEIESSPADGPFSAPAEFEQAVPPQEASAGARAADAAAHEPGIAAHERAAAVDAPPWWRMQVADLADAAQRIDLSVKMLADAAPEIDEGDLDDARSRLRELEGEVARLLQFTRTLGYVAAPPPIGSQTFDLGEIVHVFASNLAQSGPDAPRCQFKTVPGASVRSDRQLLSQALDAVFFLVRCTSRKGDLVRAQVQKVEADDGAWIELALDFPSGPLEGVPEGDIVPPYSLTDLFPELGPNALAAAAGIVAGQGGHLSLASRARGRMTWRLRLPPAGA